jgi:formate-dependent nitrite reductase membrane component NrfD
MGIIDSIWYGLLTYWAAIFWLIVLVLAVSAAFIFMWWMRKGKDNYDEKDE